MVWTDVKGLLEQTFNDRLYFISTFNLSHCSSLSIKLKISLFSIILKKLIGILINILLYSLSLAKHVVNQAQ